MDAPKTDWAETQAKLLLGSLLLITGPVDHYDENVARAKAALLEADKNGYERGRREAVLDLDSALDDRDKWLEQSMNDEALLGEAFTRIEDFHPPTSHVYRKTCGTCEFLAKLKSRLAPSVGLSEAQKLLADSGGEKKA